MESVKVVSVTELLQLARPLTEPSPPSPSKRSTWCSGQMRERSFEKDSSVEFGGVVTIGRRKKAKVEAEEEEEEEEGIYYYYYYIPLGIIAEILKHLPARDILNFRRVCKSWRSLIRSDYFIGLHLTRAEMRPPKFMLYPFKPLSSSSYQKFDVELYSTPRRPNGVPALMLRQPVLDDRIPRMVGNHCHGLNLMFTHNDIYVFNPCTREFITLPGVTPCVGQMAGLGFSHSTKEYKVVRMFFIDRRSLRLGNLMCEVLTLDSNTEAWTWREVTSPECYPVRSCEGGKYANGALHWLIDECNCSSRHIVSFDVKNETFRSIGLPLPFYEDEDRYWMCKFTRLLNYDEHLCVADFKEDIITKLWVFREDHADEGGGKWTSECCFSLSRTSFSFREFFRNPVIVSNGRVYMVTGEKLGYYSIRDKVYTTIMQPVREMQAVCYVESLVSLQRQQRERDMLSLPD